MSIPSGGRLVTDSSSKRLAIARPRRELQRFEAVLSDALSAMARVPTHEIDHEIEHWLGQICLTLDLDRCAMLHTNHGVTHRWSRENMPRVRYGIRAAEVSPWATGKVLSGEELVWSDIEELPSEAEDYKRWLRKNGPKSQVALPLRVGDSVVGGITFGKFGSSRPWPPLLLQRLRLVTQVFLAALERKRTETELQRARTKLAAAASSTMMGQLAASIAHEVNQPLGAILANAQAARRLLATRGVPAEKITAALSDIVDDSKRASEVVARVKALFKGERMERTRLDLATLFAEAESLLRSEAALRKISLEVECADALPPVLGDRVQILQCVMNLVVNGFDSIDLAATDRREVRVVGAPDVGRWLRISVHDTGGGIDPKVADRMFDPYVTTKPDGMGMGLLITQSIVGNHGGKIWASSNSSSGAIVSFTLPIVPEESNLKAAK